MSVGPKHRSRRHIDLRCAHPLWPLTRSICTSSMTWDGPMLIAREAPVLIARCLPVLTARGSPDFGDR